MKEFMEKTKNIKQSNPPDLFSPLQKAGDFFVIEK